MTTTRIYTKGTVVPSVPFCPVEQAYAINDAILGIGTNESVIIEVMSRHTREQRQIISESFWALFKKDLREELRSELSGDFLELVIALLDNPAKYDAQQLRNAMEGLGTDERSLTEILCSRNTFEITAAKDQYRCEFDRELEDDVADETSGDFKDFLMAVLAAKRSTLVSPISAESDACDLFEAGEGRWGTNETTFTRIFTERSLLQLYNVFDIYKRLYGTDIEEVIHSETSRWLREGYLTIVKLARNTSKYFAERLYQCMKGPGTNDNDLIRIVVSRSEVDMVQIKEEFLQLYGVSLERYIADDTSGYYRDLLLALCAGT